MQPMTAQKERKRWKAKAIVNPALVHVVMSHAQMRDVHQVEELLPTTQKCAKKKAKNQIIHLHLDIEVAPVV